MSPHSVISFATSPARRMFSTQTPGLGETEIAAEAVTHIVAIEQHGVVAGHVQALLDDIGDRRSAGARQAGEPEDGGPLMLTARSALPTRSGCQWILVPRRSPKAIMPAPTVWFVKRSMMMNEPVLRFAS